MINNISWLENYSLEESAIPFNYVEEVYKNVCREVEENIIIYFVFIFSYFFTKLYLFRWVREYFPKYTKIVNFLDERNEIVIYMVTVYYIILFIYKGQIKGSLLWWVLVLVFFKIISKIGELFLRWRNKKNGSHRRNQK